MTIDWGAQTASQGFDYLVSDGAFNDTGHVTIAAAPAPAAALGRATWQ